VQTIRTSNGLYLAEYAQVEIEEECARGAEKNMSSDGVIMGTVGKAMRKVKWSIGPAVYLLRISHTSTVPAITPIWE